MRLLFVTLAILPALTVATPSTRADTIFEVEHARAIARAGRPVSDLDAEYLERYGAQSGTPDWRGRYYSDRYLSYGYRSYRHRHYRYDRD